MAIPFRIIDTGVRDGRRHMALDEALIELHKAGLTPDSLRFMRFPPTVLIGRHQAMRHEVKVDHCRAAGIGLVRRITGGGAIYLDEGQVGWELILSRRRLALPTLADYTRAICEAAAHGLSAAFGIDARHRPRSDIEVDGRKLSGTGGFFDGDTLIYQGTVLVDVDPVRMLAGLNVPAAAPASRDLDRPESRLVTLKQLTGSAPAVEAVHWALIQGISERLGIEARPGATTDVEEALAARRHDEEIGTDAFTFGIDEPRGEGVLEASRQTPGGRIAAFLRLEGQGAARRIREALLTGDFFALPPRIVYDLEAGLRGVTVAGIGAAVDGLLAGAHAQVLTVAPGDIRAVIEAAAATDTGAP